MLCKFQEEYTSQVVFVRELAEDTRSGTMACVCEVNSINKIQYDTEAIDEKVNIFRCLKPLAFLCQMTWKQ